MSNPVGRNPVEPGTDWRDLTIDECLEFADDWAHGLTRRPGAVGIVCVKLAQEVRRLRVIRAKDEWRPDNE